MGSVIRFPIERLSRNSARPRPQEPATVIFLPAVRIKRWSEEHPYEPPAGAARTRRLRSRARSLK
jgi:hypothetical protein